MTAMFGLALETILCIFQKVTQKMWKCRKVMLKKKRNKKIPYQFWKSVSDLDLKGKRRKKM